MPPAPAPSPRLVARRAAGAPLPAREIDALAVPTSAHADFVFRSLQRLGVRPADLEEDVFQDVFLVVHKRLHIPTTTPPS